MDKEYLIKKWILNDLTEEEHAAFRQLDDYSNHIRIIESAQFFKSDTSNVADLDAFYTRANLPNRSVDSKKKAITFFTRYAALFLVMIGIGALYFLNGNQSKVTAIGEKISLELPDASKVMLNAKSELSYSEKEWNENREVTLEGEAFFTVTKGSTFDVVTNNAVVSVVGTQFNVKNRKGYFEVKCFEGQVRVKYNGQEENLFVGDVFTVLNGVVTSSSGPAGIGNKPNWINNVSTFKSVAFDQVLKEFERQYNVVISVENVDTSRIFTGGFVHTSLEDGLKSITLPLDLKYNIDSGNTITLYTKNP